MPKVSIVTVCRNEEKRIRLTLESVHGQTFKDFEHIVIDGGSTDGTGTILSGFRDRLSYFISEPDKGIYNAQNKGLARAQGEYVLFLNGGDYLARPDVLERVFSKPGIPADIIYGNLVIEDGAENQTLGMSPDPMTLEHLLRFTLWHPVSFIRRSLFEKYGPYDESYRICADYEFFLKVIAVHDVSTRYVDVPVAVFNTQGIGSSAAHDAIHQTERIRAQTTWLKPQVLQMHTNYRKLEAKMVRMQNTVGAKIVHKLSTGFPLAKFVAKELLAVVRGRREKPVELDE